MGMVVLRRAGARLDGQWGLVALEYIDLIEIFCQHAGCRQSTNSCADDDCAPS